MTDTLIGEKGMKMGIPVVGYSKPHAIGDNQLTITNQKS